MNFLILSALLNEYCDSAVLYKSIFSPLQMKFLSLLVSVNRGFAVLNPNVKLPHIHMIESVEEPLNALAARQLVTAHHSFENAIFPCEYADRTLGA